MHQLAGVLQSFKFNQIFSKSMRGWLIFILDPVAGKKRIGQPPVIKHRKISHLSGLFVKLYARGYILREKCTSRIGLVWIRPSPQGANLDVI
jgi:hypothetical protein